MSNGTQRQKDKKNFSRLRAGDVGYKSSAGRTGIRVLKVCITCGVQRDKSLTGKHQRKYICFDCQPKLF
jgi:hypothetical protein